MKANQMMQSPMVDEAPGTAEEPQSFEVCISQRPDGTFEVTKEVKEEPSQDPMAQEDGENIAQTIDDALNMARQMLQEGVEPTEQVSAENAFTQARGGR